MSADQREELEVRRDFGRLQSLVIAAAEAAELVLGTCEAAIDRAYEHEDDGNDGGSSNSGSGNNGQPRGPGSDPGALTRGPGGTPPHLMIPVTSPAQPPIATATPPLA